MSQDGNGSSNTADTPDLTIAELEILFARYITESAVFASLPEVQFVGVALVDSSSIRRVCVS